jgi:tetratricopeptide (TPR) repeat protein
MMLGRELESRGYFAAAATCYGRALQITPMWGPVWFSFGRTLLLTNDTPNAIRSLEQAVKLDEQPISLVWLSIALNRAGQSQKAEALLERAEAQDVTMRLKFTALQQALPAAK